VIRRALLSVSDKTGLDELAQGLADLGVELVASGGTADHLEELSGVRVERVEDLTGLPEMLGGRVKTLHPNVHGGILARRDRPEDMSALEEHGIRPIDLVCVNLYPFAATARRRGTTEAEAVEMIDVGGPAMLRAAAKNFAHVVVLCRPDQYAFVLDELRAQGEVSLETRRELAGEAFHASAIYEAQIAEWFGERESFPPTLVLPFEKVLDVAYGENPHQRAAYYAEIGARRHLLSMVTQLHGRELSFNNLNDLSAGRRLSFEFALPTCVIVKHANPCGVAVAATIEDAYERALASDPTSAYGGIVLLNRPVAADLAASIADQFVEVLLAPAYDEKALEALRAKPNTRILEDRERRRGEPSERDVKRVLGGLLVQDGDWDVDDREGMEVVCGELSEAQWGDLVFAWRVCKHVTSNAIVVGRDLATLGVGGGQMSRVDAVRLALDKAHRHSHNLAGGVLASDAFFPFPDGPRLALEAGVAAIVQPGGSRRDQDVIDAVAKAGAAMVFTHRRHFRH
jgi:phosphoribosylaminoimidazolecarboxamide formyltransferase/IMP cyclohydrolase